MLIASLILHIKWLYPILYNDRFTHPVYNDCFTHRVQWLSRPPCTMTVSPTVYNDCLAHRVQWLFHPPCTMTVSPTVYNDCFTHRVQWLSCPLCTVTISLTMYNACFIHPVSWLFHLPEQWLFHPSWTMTVSSSQVRNLPGAARDFSSRVNPPCTITLSSTMYNDCFIHPVQCSFQLPSSSLQPSSSLVCFTYPPCRMLHLSTLQNASPVLSNACMFNPFCPLLTWAYSSNSPPPPPQQPPTSSGWVCSTRRWGTLHSASLLTRW